MSPAEHVRPAGRELFRSLTRLGFGRMSFAASRPGELERSNGEDIAVRRHVRHWPSTPIYRPTVWVEDEFNLWQLAFYLISPRWEVVGAADLHPGITSDQYEEWGRSQMTSTIDVAKVVALGHLGYQVRQLGKGVIVVSVGPGPAMGALHDGDVIVAVNDTEIRTTDELGSVLNTLVAERTIKLTVDALNSSEAARTSVTVPLSENFPRLGAIVRTYKRSFDYPVDIDISVDGAGASGSLAIALGIIDVLTEVDLALVPTAATGVLHPDGSIGQVTGVRQKAMSLEGKQVRRMLVRLARQPKQSPPRFGVWKSWKFRP